MSKATEKELTNLHAELARVLKDAVGKDYTSEDNPTGLPPAAILNVARQFLKDNLVIADPNVSPDLKQMMELPVFDEDGEVQGLRH